MRLTRAALKAQAEKSEKASEEAVHPDQKAPQSLLERTPLRDITDDNQSQAETNIEDKQLLLSLARTQAGNSNEDVLKTARLGPKRKTQKQIGTSSVAQLRDKFSSQHALTNQGIGGPEQVSSRNQCHDSLNTNRKAIPTSDPQILITHDIVIEPPSVEATDHLLVDHKTSVKLNSSLSPDQRPQIAVIPSDHEILTARSPSLRRTSSTSFEASFEAMDSLEDTIEQLTAGLPTLPANEMQSPESPMKSLQESLRPQRSGSTPSRNSSVSRSPQITSARLSVAVGISDKENTPPSRTPSRQPSKTRVAAKAGASTRQPSPAKARTPAASVNRKPVEPVKRPATTKANLKPVVRTVSNTSSTSQRSTAATSLKSGPVQRKAVVSTTSQNTKPIQNRTITAVGKHSGHSSSKSVSVLPHIDKPESPVQKRRVTSMILSTAKPGFKPAKSTKAPTVSTFVLPGETVTEKFKAQKEAREERMRTQNAKLALAEEKSAKLKAEREARQERFRQNQKLVAERTMAKQAKVMSKHS